MTARLLFAAAALTAFIGLAFPTEAHHSPLEDIRPLPKPMVADPD